LTVATFCVICTKEFLISHNIIKYEYDCLFLFVVFSSICLCFADDFLIFYLTIELQSLAFYVFAAFNRGSEFTSEAGLKYFIFGSIISCFLLLSFCFFYLLFGSLSFEVLFSVILMKDNFLSFLGVVFLLFALLFKIGAAPFHS
jgi:NADH-quinone oxidoreductase subunit N